MNDNNENLITKLELSAVESTLDLNDYNKVVIPWDEGGNMYVYMKPTEHTQEIFIGSDENLNEQPRVKTITFRTNAPNVTINNQKTVDLQVTQSKATYQYSLIIKTDPEDFVSFPASGGTVTLKAYMDTYVNGVYKDTKLVPATYEITNQSSAEGFSLSNSQLSAEDRGNTEGGQRSVFIRATYNSVGATREVSYSQDANTKTMTDVTIQVTSAGASIDRLPAKEYTNINFINRCEYTYSSDSTEVINIGTGEGVSYEYVNPNDMFYPDVDSSGGTITIYPNKTFEAKDGSVKITLTNNISSEPLNLHQLGLDGVIATYDDIYATYDNIKAVHTN